jgi:hypothetical protein
MLPPRLSRSWGRRCHRCRLGRCWLWVVDALSGQGQEHLVEARQVQGQLRDGNALDRQRRHRGCECRLAVDRNRDLVTAGELAGGRGDAGQNPPDVVQSRAIGGFDPDPLAADGAFETLRGVVRDHPATVDDGDLVGQGVGLLEVLGGQQHRGTVGDQAPDHIPHVFALGRVQPGRRLVQEDHPGAAHQAGREIEPPPHATGVGLGHPAGVLGEIEPLQELGRAGLGVPGGQVQ